MSIYPLSSSSYETAVGTTSLCSRLVMLNSLVLLLEIRF